MEIGSLAGKEKERGRKTKMREKRKERKSRKEVGLSSCCMFAKTMTCVSAPRVPFVPTPVFILLSWIVNRECNFSTM